MHRTITKLPVLMIIFLAIILSGCVTSKLDRTIKESKSPILLAFKDGELQVIDVASGKRLPACDEIPINDKRREHACKSLDSVKILSNKTIYMVEYEGSLCASINDGNIRTDYCSPPYPRELIEALFE